MLLYLSCWLNSLSAYEHTALYPGSGVQLWREMHRWGKMPVVTDKGKCPPEPWIAVALDEGILSHPNTTEWLGDFERCLAWGFWEIKNVNS